MNSKPWDGRAFQGDIGKAQEGDDYAVAWITWDDAASFCKKLTDDERAAGRLSKEESYALPTEAQWEYACRAGTTTRFSWGDNVSAIEEFAWWGALYHGNAEGQPYPHRVGLKKPNPWGLYDIHGNNYEMCSDLYEDKVKGGIDPVGGTAGTRRVIKGGSWYGEADNCRCSMRGGWPPFDNEPFLPWHDVGFRVALVSNGK
jgi:formylglycine-generating enzyme required for sulfatase activity